METNTQGVSEALRDAVAKAIADVIGHGMREKCYAHADAAIAALSAPEPAAQGEAVAWQINATMTDRGWENCTQECYEDTLRTGRYMGLPAGATDVKVRELFTRPANSTSGEAVGYTQLSTGGYAIATLLSRGLNLPAGTWLYTAPPAQPAERVPEEAFEEDGKWWVRIDGSKYEVSLSEAEGWNHCLSYLQSLATSPAPTSKDNKA